MLKLYFLVAIVYSISKALSSQTELSPVIVIGEFLKNFLLFPLVAIRDIVAWATKNMKEEEVKNNKNRQR